MQSRKRVTFSNRPPEVRTVPRGGRELEPGFLARTIRYAALKKHKLPGGRLSRRALDDEYGDGTGGGRAGQYTDVQARRNTWHRMRYGTSWYRPVMRGGKVVFLPKDRDTNAKRATMMLEYLTGLHTYEVE